MPEVAQTPAFKKAIEDSRKLKSMPTNDELLELYALFKQGSSHKIEEAEAPGMFDLKGKAKLKAWKKVADEKTTPDKAQKDYVALVEQLKNRLGTQ
ncbi:MAG: acyl binding [Lasallia pustulata]|uniref:Acyl binding n=1 Tax=Lasallia pustulata TaxID=136370 RepID=A0A5M8PXF3_9LECA|nr:MAG: acyl binding [Lasallia pustulata]